MRFIEAEGATLAEMKESARKSDLFQLGDMKLIWVNEGDLIADQIRAINEAEVSTLICECGMMGPCMDPRCRSPLAANGI